MSIDPLNIDSLKVLRPDQSEPPQQLSPQRADDAGPPPSQVLFTGTGPRAPGEILRRKEEYGADAVDLRHRDQLLAQLGQKIGPLKEPLQAIVKQFPPYAPEDEERVKFLKQYASLRKEIDALTVPRPAEEGAPDAPPPLPAPLPPRATDSQISDHINDLDSAGLAVDELRGTIASRAPLLAERGALSALSGAGLSGFSGLSPAARHESAALEKSVQIGQQFASRTGHGVSASNPHFLKSLG